METARYCYQVPLLLGQGYQQSNKDPTNKSLEIFGYAIHIEGLKNSFVLLSPTYIGELCTFSIKLPKRHPDGSVTIERKKISFNKPEIITLPEADFKTIFDINTYLWKHVLPDLNLDQYEVKEIEKSEPGEKLFTKSTYSELRRQYLIFPTTPKTDPNTGEVKDVYDMEIIKRMSKNIQKKKSSSKFVLKDIKKYFYKSKSGKKLIMLIDGKNFQTAKCFDFLSALHKTLTGGKKMENNPEQIVYMLKLIESLGMKDLDIKKIRFIDYLYTTAVDSTMRDPKSALRVLKNFVTKNPDRKKIENSNFYFGVKGVTAQDYDFNFWEKLDSFRTNQELRTMVLEQNQFVMDIEENLENSYINIKLMDRLLLMPSILINVERLAHVREFKIYNKFLFMKNYPLLKALSSRSFDKIMNNETLETLGDSVLKTIITLHLYTSSKDNDEN